MASPRLPRSLIAATLAATLAACSGSETEPLPVETKPGAASAPAAQPTRAAAAAPAVRFGEQAAAGTPHSAAIDRVELAPDGSAALTRDSRGGVRVWPSLDGSAQPQRVPVGSPRHMSLARRRGGRELILALVDSAGELRLFRADGRGHTAAIESRADGRPALAAVVLAGGERLAILRDDHTLELADQTGALLARLDQRGFRPAAVAATAAGDALVAISVKPGGTTHRVAIHRIDIADRALTLRPSPLEVTAAAAVGPSRWAVNPSGTRVALLAAPSDQRDWRLIAADLEAGTTETVELQLVNTEQLAIGFLDDRNVIATGGANSGSLRIDLGQKDGVYPTVTPDLRGGQLIHATAAGTRVAAVVTWLWVQARGRESLYMGYDQFQATDGAISPDKRWVTWASNTGLYVRGLRGQQPARSYLPNPSRFFGQAARVFFIDERHLVVFDPVGELELLDVTTGEEVAAVDPGGTAAQVEVDAGRGLVALVHAGGQVWLYRVSAEHGFRGPLIVVDGAARLGFLAGSGPALWTLDTSRKFRTYDVGDFERGLSRSEAMARGTALTFSPDLLDRQGRFLVLGDGTRQIQRFTGTEGGDPERTFPRQPVGPVRAFPSPDGQRMAIARPDGVVTVFDGEGDRPSWTRSFLEIVQNVTWSADGSLVAVADRLGAAVLDGATGEVTDLTCSALFLVRRAPPLIPQQPLNLPSLCEADGPQSPR